ncbi:acylphosphatase [Kineococcus arenarius]|uniref:acylphosphatase n=1 Tax=Kineococcus sp. SYSU DK007 TaxID=3383128 RepID=UPI003D7DD033
MDTSSGAGTPPVPERLTAFVSGRVQGVGFRWWTRSQALELGLSGRAVNKTDGRVEVVAEGPAQRLEELLERLREEPSAHGRPGRVTAVVEHRTAARGESGFTTR